MPKNPPKSIKIVNCGDCGLKIRDGVAICQNCGSKDFHSYKYVLESQLIAS